MTEHNRIGRFDFSNQCRLIIGIQRRDRGVVAQNLILRFEFVSNGVRNNDLMYQIRFHLSLTKDRSFVSFHFFQPDRSDWHIRSLTIIVPYCTGGQILVLFQPCQASR